VDAAAGTPSAGDSGVIPSEIKNRLAEALTITAEEPYIDNQIQRNRVRREYQALHQHLRAIDEWLRDWKPVRQNK